MLQGRAVVGGIILANLTCGLLGRQRAKARGS
jgi:hypothetical protein